MSEHTPGPWARGRTLSTPQTRRWSAAEIAANDARENLMVFANFSAVDQGRSRQRVAICSTAENARLIAAAPELLDALQRIVDWDAAGLALTEDHVNQARAAIAKATGGQP